MFFSVHCLCKINEEFAHYIFFSFNKIEIFAKLELKVFNSRQGEDSILLSVRNAIAFCFIVNFI